MPPRRERGALVASWPARAHIGGMRGLILGIVLLCAGPAAAQDAQTLQLQLDSLRLQQQMAQQRAVALEGQLMAAEAQLRADQAAAEAEAARAPARLPQLPYPTATPAPLDVSRLPTIPEATLTASNRRVRELRNRETSDGR